MHQKVGQHLRLNLDIMLILHQVVNRSGAPGIGPDIEKTFGVFHPTNQGRCRNTMNHVRRFSGTVASYKPHSRFIKLEQIRIRTAEAQDIGAESIVGDYDVGDLQPGGRDIALPPCPASGSLASHIRPYPG